eukprot:CAMPEP_0202438692 /NCGR_PEP_ID=MMETSP1345-20130828/34749_1 /ASSEMBLY_ACC=CAM_ASM_000843 /TAXON_ID=342563 /ORGANISM="Fabrea Fabrea salina" /LENGTH=159 /DNA_ID=CAMNT_0049053059 /DNA_START=353 /DNA_END=832 /DNA_ORIENTATION=+
MNSSAWENSMFSGCSCSSGAVDTASSSLCISGLKLTYWGGPIGIGSSCKGTCTNSDLLVKSLSSAQGLSKGGSGWVLRGALQRLDICLTRDLTKDSIWLSISGKDRLVSLEKKYCRSWGEKQETTSWIKLMRASLSASCFPAAEFQITSMLSLVNLEFV